MGSHYPVNTSRILIAHCPWPFYWSVFTGKDGSIEFRHTVGTKTVGKPCAGSILNEFLHLLPIALVVPDLFAGAADRQESSEHLHLVQRLLKFPGPFLDTALELVPGITQVLHGLLHRIAALLQLLAHGVEGFNEVIKLIVGANPASGGQASHGDLAAQLGQLPAACAQPT